MATEIKRRGGSTVEHASFTGSERELTVDTTKNTVVVHDGATLGGHPLAKESHLHPMTEIGGGAAQLAVSDGGTGANNAIDALSNLGGAAAGHVHSINDLDGLGAGSTVFVDNDVDFLAEYSGVGPKTIVMAAGTYTLPATFIPGINLIALGSWDDVSLQGNMVVNTLSSLRTTFSNVHLHGDITVGASFNNVLSLHECHHHNGTLIMNTPNGEVSTSRGEIDKFTLTLGTLEMLGTQVTGGGSTFDDGRLEMYHCEIEVDTIEDVLTMNGGVLIVTSLIYGNPSGNGFVMNGGTALIDGVLKTVSSVGLAMQINGSVLQSIVTMGSHNLDPSDIVQNGGTFIPMNQQLPLNSVDTQHLIDDSVDANKLAVDSVDLTHAILPLRVYSESGTIPVINGGETMVLQPFVNFRGKVRAVKFQTLDPTAGTVDTALRLHDQRNTGEQFPASSVQVGPLISVGQLFTSNLIDASCFPNQAVSVDFGTVAGAAQLDNVLWTIIYEKL